MSVYPYERKERLRKLLLQKISEIVYQLQNPQIGFLTITDLKLSDDLLKARVFYSVLGSAEEQSKTTGILTRSIGFVKYRLYKELRLRKVPDIEFVYDELPQKTTEVLSILNKIAEEKKQLEKPKKKSPQFSTKTIRGDRK